MLEVEVGKIEESFFSVEEFSIMFCFLLIGGRFLFILEVKLFDRFLSKSKDLLREEEKEKKKKKYKKRF